MTGMSQRHGLRVANVFHAGDGNLHPLILYDANVPGELDRAEAFAAEILRTCVAMGGVLTGEHGVGVEKRDLMGEMFNEVDLAHQERIKCAFDPGMLLNPGKVFPDAAPLRRIGAHARASRGGRISRHPALLKDMAQPTHYAPATAAEVQQIVAEAALREAHTGSVRRGLEALDATADRGGGASRHERA